MPSDIELSWTSTGLSHVGKIRNINEDSILERPEIGLWVVADGMGGHAAGDVASRMIVTELGEIERRFEMDADVALVRERLEQVNRRLLESAPRRGGITGSTVAILLACGQRATALWAGDSRVYVYRDNRLAQLTRDHSRVREWIDQGLLEPEEAREHPASNIITRAVGADIALELESAEFDVMAGDIFLLCSDGLSNEVTDEEMEAALVTRDCTRATQQLLGLVLSRRARDNVSIIVARPDENEDTDIKTLLNPAITFED